MALKGDKEIGDKIIAGLASADDLRGVIGQADFNDQGRLGSGSLLINAADGWLDAARPPGIVEDKARKIEETPDLTIKRRKYKMDLIPSGLIEARFFAAEQAALEALRAEQEAAARTLEEFIEEHGAEEGLLAEAVNDKGKITKASVKEALALAAPSRRGAPSPSMASSAELGLGVPGEGRGPGC